MIIKKKIGGCCRIFCVGDDFAPPGPGGLGLENFFWMCIGKALAEFRQKIYLWNSFKKLNQNHINIFCKIHLDTVSSHGQRRIFIGLNGIKNN